MDAQQDLRSSARSPAEEHSFEIRVEARSGGMPHQKQIDLREAALAQAKQYGENEDMFLSMYDQEISALAADHLSLEISRQHSIMSAGNLLALIITIATLGFVIYLFNW